MQIYAGHIKGNYQTTARESMKQAAVYTNSGK
jgi:hypothetical protein